MNLQIVRWIPCYFCWIGGCLCAIEVGRHTRTTLKGNMNPVLFVFSKLQLVSPVREVVTGLYNVLGDTYILNYAFAGDIQPYPNNLFSRCRRYHPLGLYAHDDVLLCEKWTIHPHKEPDGEVFKINNRRFSVIRFIGENCLRPSCGIPRGIVRLKTD